MNDDQIMLIIYKYADIINNNNILNIQIFRKNPSNGRTSNPMRILSIIKNKCFIVLKY